LGCLVNNGDGTGVTYDNGDETSYYGGERKVFGEHLNTLEKFVYK
jgi:hypothetical protein